MRKLVDVNIAAGTIKSNDHTELTSPAAVSTSRVHHPGAFWETVPEWQEETPDGESMYGAFDRD